MFLAISVLVIGRWLYFVQSLYLSEGLVQNRTTAASPPQV